MTDKQRLFLRVAYLATPPQEDMTIPDDVDATDAAIYAAHLQEIGYGIR